MNIPTPSLQTKRVLTSSWGTLLIALIIASPLIYWAVDRRDPVDIRSLELWPAEVRAGEKITRVITVYRRQSCETEVDVLITDGARVRWIIDEPPLLSPGVVGVVESYKAPIIIPPMAAPGDAEIRLVAKRKCNPLHQLWPIISAYGPLKFKILPP